MSFESGRRRRRRCQLKCGEQAGRDGGAGRAWLVERCGGGREAGIGLCVSDRRRSDALSRSAQPVAAEGSACGCRGCTTRRRSEWTDARWQAPPLASAVIYEMHIGTFTQEGTFDGAIAQLDYLAELGVTHVEVMPVADVGGRPGMGL